MEDVWERVSARTDLPVNAVLDRLKSGEALAGIGEALRLRPAELVSAVAQAALGGDEAPSLVQTAPTRPWLEETLDESAWAELFPRSSRTSRLALAAGLLQIHDFWNASHEAAQEADDLGERRVSAYWHGIAHRREPDPGNASYWFRRVGRHSLFGPLADAARSLLEDGGDSRISARLLASGAWNPMAFIDFCGEAGRNASLEALAKKLQRLEMIMLLGETVEALGGWGLMR